MGSTKAKATKYAPAHGLSPFFFVLLGPLRDLLQTDIRELENKQDIG